MNSVWSFVAVHQRSTSYDNSQISAKYRPFSTPIYIPYVLRRSWLWFNKNKLNSGNYARKLTDMRLPNVWLISIVFLFSKQIKHRASTTLIAGFAPFLSTPLWRCDSRAGVRSRMDNNELLWRPYAHRNSSETVACADIVHMPRVLIGTLGTVTGPSEESVKCSDMLTSPVRSKFETRGPRNRTVRRRSRKIWVNSLVAIIHLLSFLIQYSITTGFRISIQLLPRWSRSKTAMIKSGRR